MRIIAHTYNSCLPSNNRRSPSNNNLAYWLCSTNTCYRNQSLYRILTLTTTVTIVTKAIRNGVARPANSYTLSRVFDWNFSGKDESNSSNLVNRKVLCRTPSRTYRCSRYMTIFWLPSSEKLFLSAKKHLSLTMDDPLANVGKGF